MIRENKKLPPDVTGKVPEIVEAISGDPDVVAHFSFGSLAEARLTPWSDLEFRFFSRQLRQRISRGRVIGEWADVWSFVLGNVRAR